MKNSMRRLFGILTQVGFTILSTIAMYVCSFVVQIGGLYDDEMPRTLVLPLIMMIPALIIYLIWFGSKAKKFTNGTYIGLDNKYGSSSATASIISPRKYSLPGDLDIFILRGAICHRFTSAMIRPKRLV